MPKKQGDKKALSTGNYWARESRYLFLPSVHGSLALPGIKEARQVLILKKGTQGGFSWRLVSASRLPKERQRNKIG